jgi:hypothetical protein
VHTPLARLQRIINSGRSASGCSPGARCHFLLLLFFKKVKSMRGTNQDLGPTKRGRGAQHHKDARPAPRRVLLQVEELEGRVVPSTIILGPSKDNTLFQSLAGDISDGAGSYFFAGKTNHAAIRRGVIAFDIAGNIPAGATINSATLSLHMSMTISGAQAIELHWLSADWGQGTSNSDSNPGQGAPATTNDATWVYRFFNTTATWTNLGGDFVNTVSASTFVGGFGFYTWGSTTQMVTDVQGWLDTPSNNFGWIVLGNETTFPTTKRFDSSKNSTIDFRPTLTIDYTSTSTASTLALSGFPSPVTAGVAGTETVTARDSSGNTATNYRGTIHFTSTDPQAALPANYTFTAADAGVHTFNITLKTAGTQSITATDTTTSTITGSQSGILVTPAAAASFNLSGFPSPTTAGVVGTETVTAQDAFGNTATGYTGTVHFTSSDSQAGLPADYTFTAADAGVHAFSATLETAGTRSITATDTATSTITGSQNGILVTAAAAASFNLSGFPSPTTAGVAGTQTVTAQDAFGNTATGYTGTVHFTSSDSQAGLPADYTFTAADAGVHNFSATLKTAGNQSITATDTAAGSITGSQSGITVSAAALDHFSITSAGTVAAGMPFDLIVTALDLYGNTVTGYTGTVTFSTSDQDPQVSLPTDYTFTAADNGTHIFSGGATLYTMGDQTITVADTSDNTINGMLTVTL